MASIIATSIDLTKIPKDKIIRAYENKQGIRPAFCLLLAYVD